MSDYIAIGSYEIVKRLKLPKYYYYILSTVNNIEIIYLLSYEVQFVFFNNVDGNGYLIDKTTSIFLRDIIHDMFPLVYKMMIIFCFAIFNIVILALLMTVTIVIVKNDSLMRKSTNKYEDVSAKTSGVTLLALEAFYKGIG